MELASSMHNTLRAFRTAVEEGAGMRADWGMSVVVKVALLRSDIAFWGFRAQWTSHFIDRLRALIREGRLSHLRWMLPRLFGLTGFLIIKRAPGLMS